MTLSLKHSLLCILNALQALPDQHKLLSCSVILGVISTHLLNLMDFERRYSFVQSHPPGGHGRQKADESQDVP